MRLFGYLLALSGANLIFSPARALFSHLWIVGWILNAGIHTFACLCATSCSTCTMASAYIAYRPLYGLFLIFMPLAVFGYIQHQEHQWPFATTTGPPFPSGINDPML